MYLYLLVNSNVNTKRVASGTGASFSSAIAQPCPKLSTLHRFALTLQFHNRFIDRPSHAQAKMKHFNATENLSTLIKICVSSLLLFRFSTIYLLRLFQFHHLSFSLVCNFSATHIKRLRKINK